MIEHVDWNTVKQFCESKSLPMQYVEDAEKYTIYAYDGPFALKTYIIKLESASDEQIEFEATFKSECNKKINTVDPDGAQIINPKLASAGRRYQSMFMSFTVGLPGSLIAKNYDNSDNTDFVLECYKADDTVVTVESSAEDKALIVKSRVEWNPAMSYDVQGFCIYQKTQPETNMFLSAIAAYEVPQVYGGTIVAVRGCNLRMAPYGNREIDWVGDSASSITYDPVYNSHEQEIVVYHEANVQHEIMCEVIWYV